MRIIQIIDSLEAGGAERMAVNYANGLTQKIEFSGLVATRKEGVLQNQINEKVSYLFLNKKKKIDFSAVFRLRKYIQKSGVTIIHAHSSSFFIAILVKLTLPQIKIIWHDHYGISQDLSSRKNVVLKLASLLFNGSIAVNSSLKNWAESYLLNFNVVYFPNFISTTHDDTEKIQLKGYDGKRIICVANLRPQKNHKLLLEAAITINKQYPDWTFHLFGKDFEDTYSAEIKNIIKDSKLEETVFLYGSTNNIVSALQQCNIAVLTSLSEGLPLAILEYGQHKLPVIATKVGEIDKIITSEKEGLIVESNNVNEFINALKKLIPNENYRDGIALTLNKKVLFEYSEKNIIDHYVTWLNSLSNFTKKDSLQNEK
ncbi:glycosyltransferase [Flavobacterium piscis]|uniref:Glycosyltransferase involved in cell wall biosynthesis n=1 Tax=Flavobacterium piscis TaxID=1114874 RepID=A0ABU1Y3Y2_9FLAO|nr:glycosyltransferase [Flavobacterium piscis]MDR7208939.1 glycosyltransferase involved in cell wall biosynthesis [Flavobacterium piscis]